MNYQQAYQPQPANPPPANFHNPNQGSPIIKYILITGAVLLTLLIIATVVIFILSRTYADEDSKDDKTSETGILEDALRADLLDAGIACDYMDRGFLINLFVIGSLGGFDEATSQPVNTFDKNDHKTLTDTFKGPVFSCTDTENTDITSFRLTPDDFKVMQEITMRGAFEQESESTELANKRAACANPAGAQEVQQSFEESAVDDIFDNELAIEGWVFTLSDDSASLENQLTEAGIRTKDLELINVCDILLN